jgi:myosin-5
MAAYGKGTRVWLPDVVTGWAAATVSSITIPADESPSADVTLVLAYDAADGVDGGDLKTLHFPYSVLVAASAPGAANVQPASPVLGQDALPPLRNPPLLESAEDLASLSNLNEPSGEFDLGHANGSPLCHQDEVRTAGSIHVFRYRLGASACE